MKVYLEFRSPTHHTLYDELINYPPEGVEYIISSGEVYSTKGYKLFNILYNNFLKSNAPNIGNIYHNFKGKGKTYDLIHICNNFTPKKTAWVMDLENAGTFTSHDYQIFKKFKKEIEKSLTSENCKKIIPFTAAGKRNLEYFLDTTQFKDKIEIVHPAIHPLSKKDSNAKNDNQITLLFMGSINNPNTFVSKGGLYALQCFKRLSKLYDITLIIRSIVPPEIKTVYEHLPGLIFIDTPLSKNEICGIYKRSNILLLPGPNYALMSILESMAFGLPIVAVNGWSTSDFVIDNVTGFLIKPSKTVHDIDWTINYEDNCQTVNIDVLNNLIEKISLLIDDTSMRTQMGQNAKKRIESGDLSIKHRNIKLKQIYENSIG